MSNPTAAIIIIGNEILSGRTLDTNTQYIAQGLATSGIDLMKSIIIPDDADIIIKTIRSISEDYDYIFTTGGIGPTHDDITSKAIADTFNVPLELNDTAYKSIETYYDGRGLELNAAREKMAYIPKTATLINNPVSGAPGFVINNVYVMAGVPNIMQAMFDIILPTLRQGKPVISMSIDATIAESLIAFELTNLQDKYPQVQIGSYPFENENEYGTTLVLRSSDIETLKEAYSELEIMISHKV
ncbi:MAG: competence/damage-inducible protein A [Janthinobacterium lividum]